VNTRTIASIALAALAAATTTTVAGAAVHGTRATAVISRNANGPSHGGSFSQDGRRVGYYAFTSSASNLVSDDTNGRQDVFVLRRGSSPSSLGGALQRASVSSSGEQANGDSSNPSVDGDTNHSPHCVVFQSTASNLSTGARDNASHVFLRNLRSRRTTLVSVGQDGATDPVIDGACEFVTYDVAGTVYLRDLEADRTYRIGAGVQPDQQTDGKGVAYVRDGQVWYQAFQKIYNHGHPKVVQRGGERLVSAGAHGAGNGPSAHPSVSDNGDYIAFESNATNLCENVCHGISQDGNGATTDVFRRTMSHHAATHDRMEMASFSAGVHTQGNGPSNDPVISGSGQFIAFDSAADNLRPSTSIRDVDPNGSIRDVYLWNAPAHKGGVGNVSRESRPGPKGAFNGPSTSPALSSHGNFVAFASSEVGALPNDSSALPKVLIRYLGGK
jgi:WD40-like Beta Propeller Repeat